MIRRTGLAWIALLALAITACDEESPPDDDAGSPVDAGGMDAGPGDEDGGPGEDAGPVADAAPDASDPPDGGPTGPTLADFREGYRQAACELLVECESKLGPLGLLTERVCHPAEGMVFDGLNDSVAGGTVTYDPVAARTCLDDFGALGCADLFSLESPFDMLCRDVFTPTVAAGDPCARDEECVDGRCVVEATCPGTCVALAEAGMGCDDDDECAEGLACVGGSCEARRGEGGSCAGDDDDCMAGLYCEAGTCATRPTEGDPCERPVGVSECADALVCTGPEGSRTCATGAADGASCDADTPCAPGLRCNDGSNTCIRIVAAGGACSASRQCPFYFWCDGGTCVPLPTAGESCSLAPSCVQGQCESGTCERRADGETCRGSFVAPFGDCDAGLYCDSGTCTATSSDGASCTDDDECGDGMECRDDGTDDTCRPICTSS
ncbi:MAG TPA: hypothetical protein RMH99_00530 [Sandaracinaceae bacterium LLY-WYZ-13_1]|nr:hypothetical protein [Sandaracinaceae bacterium LLY-WYZ-13_1]